MLRPGRPDPPLSSEPEVISHHPGATFVQRGNLNFSVERVADYSATGRPIGCGLRSPTFGSTTRPEVVGESGQIRSRLGIRTGNSDRMRLIVEENGHCSVVLTNPATSRSGASTLGAPSPSRNPSSGGRPRSSEGWERGDAGRMAGGGPLSPVSAVRSPRLSSGSLPRLGRPLVAAAVCPSPSLPVDMPARHGGAPSPGIPGVPGWKGHQPDSDGSQSSCNMTSTSQRPASKEEDGEIHIIHVPCDYKI